MASDRSQPAPPPPPAALPAQTKVRLRFRKDGDLRFVSHHDLMKVFERMFRRAGLPVVQTKGFHPSPRMVFSMSLALGIIGCEEVLELVLEGEPSAEEVLQGLASQTPPGLTMLSAKTIEKKLTGQVRTVCYRVARTDQSESARTDQSGMEDLARRIEELLRATECWVERSRPHQRRLDVRPLIRAVRLLPDHLEMELWVTPTGAVRPEEVLGLLGLATLTAEGAVLERTRMELHDETQDTDPVPQMKEIREDNASTPADPQSRPTALLPGPLSFDS